MALACSCDRGITVCPTAEKLWRSYQACNEIAEALFGETCKPDVSPLLHDRWRLAREASHAALRRYEDHVDGAAVVPEPQSLRVVP